MIQFGYVVLFAAAMPLAALFALFNNVIEMRTDAFLLLKAYKVRDTWADVRERVHLGALVLAAALSIRNSHHSKYACAFLSLLIG